MSRIVIYLTRPNKLENTDCAGKHNWGDINTPKLYQTASENEQVIFLYDGLSSENLKAEFTKILQGSNEYAIVHHENMEVRDRSFLNFLFDDSKLVGDQYGRHESEATGATQEMMFEIYNKYLFDALESFNEETGTISDASFEALWQVFEKKSELELGLNLLHGIYFGKANSEFDSDEYKVLRQKPEIKASYDELVISLNEGKYDHSMQEKLVTLRDKVLLLSITNQS